MHDHSRGAYKSPFLPLPYPLPRPSLPTPVDLPCEESRGGTVALLESISMAIASIELATACGERDLKLRFREPLLLLPWILR